MGPTVEGFGWFIFNIMGIPTQYLSASSPTIQWVYDLAYATVNQVFACVPSRTSPNKQIVYTQMVYNLAGHYLVSTAADNGTPYKTDNNGQPIGYFQYLRQGFGLNTFWAGVVEEAQDETTRTRLHIPESLDNLTIDDIALTKTPWGRIYLGKAQAWNQPWGLS